MFRIDFYTFVFCEHMHINKSGVDGLMCLVILFVLFRRPKTDVVLVWCSLLIRCSL